MSVSVLNDQPLISPLHITSVLTYKFNLIETTFYNEQMLYKIKVTPRKKGNAAWSGYIWILDKQLLYFESRSAFEQGWVDSL